MKCKIGIVCTTIGIITALSATAIVLYKKSKNKSINDLTEEKTSLDDNNIINNAQNELSKLDKDSVSVIKESPQFPNVSLNDKNKKINEDD